MRKNLVNKTIFVGNFSRQPVRQSISLANSNSAGAAAAGGAARRGAAPAGVGTSSDIFTLLF